MATERRKHNNIMQWGDMTLETSFQNREGTKNNGFCLILYDDGNKIFGRCLLEPLFHLEELQTKAELVLKSKGNKLSYLFGQYMNESLMKNRCRSIIRLHGEEVIQKRIPVEVRCSEIDIFEATVQENVFFKGGMLRFGQLKILVDPDVDLCRRSCWYNNKRIDKKYCPCIAVVVAAHEETSEYEGNPEPTALLLGDANGNVILSGLKKVGEVRKNRTYVLYDQEAFEEHYYKFWEDAQSSGKRVTNCTALNVTGEKLCSITPNDAVRRIIPNLRLECWNPSDSSKSFFPPCDMEWGELYCDHYHILLPARENGDDLLRSSLFIPSLSPVTSTADREKTKLRKRSRIDKVTKKTNSIEGEESSLESTDED